MTINSKSWNIPIVLFILAFALLGVKYYQVTQLRDGVIESERRQQAAEETVKREAERMSDAQTQVAFQTKDEEALFVNDLRVRANNHNLTFVRWTASPPERAPEGTTTAPPTTGLRIIPVKANVEIQGDYESLREMVDALVRGPRLVVIESANWDRANFNGISKLSFQITRFVVPAPAEGTVGAMSAIEHGGSQ